MRPRFPDPQNSLLSLVSSVLAYYGASPGHPTLPQMDRLLAEKYRNFVLMLFDGMGTSILEKHLPQSAFLRRNQIHTVSSVFPPTTTAATVTVETGLSPIEHGWLGWSLFFEEVGTNVSVFPNTQSETEGIPAAPFHVAQRFLPYRDVFDKIGCATHGSVRAVRVSAYSGYRSGSVRDICKTVASLCGEEGRHYIYTYWHQPDYDIHDFGTAHERAAVHVRHINDEVEAMCRGLSDTLVVVTADHGLTDTAWRFLCDFPDLTACLLRAPSIENRAMSLTVKPGLRERFARRFLEVFGGEYLLFSKQQVLSENLFGSGVPHPRAAGFIGDFLAVATGPVSIAYAPPEHHGLFRAAHAGLTPDETDVPLIAIVCR